MSHIKLLMFIRHQIQGLLFFLKSWVLKPKIYKTPFAFNGIGSYGILRDRLCFF